MVDDPDEQYETVDVAEYFGGRDVASTDPIVLSQLKYSTRHGETAWTAARLCQKRVKKAEGKPDSERSVITELLRVGHRSGDGPRSATSEAPGLLIEMSTSQPRCSGASLVIYPAALDLPHALVE